MSEVRFYLDENVNPIVAEQLRKLGIDALSVRDLERLGDHDRNHLERATKLDRVLCTHDQDFLRLAATGTNHSGIVFAEHYEATIGGWVRALNNIHAEFTSAQMQRTLLYVKAR